MSESSQPISKPRRGVNGGEAVLDDGRRVELADFRERVSARFLDPVIVCLFALAALFVAPIEVFLPEFCIGGPGGGDCSRALTPEIRSILRAVNLIASFAFHLVLVFYESATIGLSGQTWGKRRRRVRVVGLGGGAPSSARAFARCLVPAAAGIAGSVGTELAGLRASALWGLGLWFLVYVSAMWGRKGRGWHDMAAGTVVVVDPEDLAQPARPARFSAGPSSVSGEAAAGRGSGQS